MYARLLFIPEFYPCQLWTPRREQLSAAFSFTTQPPQTSNQIHFRPQKHLKILKLITQTPFSLPFPSHLPPINHQLPSSPSRPRQKALGAEKRPGILCADQGRPSLWAEAAEEPRAAEPVPRQGQAVPERLFPHGVAPEADGRVGR